MIHLRRREAPVAVEGIGLGAEALEHPAVQQVLLAVIEGQEMLRAGDDACGAVECDLHSLCVGMNLRQVKPQLPSIYDFLGLKDQVIKNSAMGSPAALAPSERARMVWPSPVAMARSIVSRMPGPSLQ